MKSIFQIPDYTGILVTLGEHEWSDKITSNAPTGHPEVADYLAEIRATISDPDIVFESNNRVDTHLFCRLHVGRGKYDGKHLTVVVKYVQETAELRGYVSTIYLVRALATKRRIVWKKRDLLTN